MSTGSGIQEVEYRKYNRKEVSYLMKHGRLSLPAYSVHHPERLEGVVSLGRLSAQHDAIRSVQNSVGYVTGFGSSGAGLCDHRLQHLHRHRVDLRLNINIIQYRLHNRHKVDFRMYINITWYRL